MWVYAATAAKLTTPQSKESTELSVPDASDPASLITDYIMQTAQLQLAP